jgi:hypothetical protein
MQDASAASDERRRNVGGETQDRGTGTERSAQSSPCIEHTRARDDREHSGLPAAFRVAKRQIGRGLLVPSSDESYAIAGAV